MSRQARTIALTAVITLVAVIVLQNLRSVSLRIIVWQPTIPLVLLLGLIFGGGFLAGWLWRRR